PRDEKVGTWLAGTHFHGTSVRGSWGYIRASSSIKSRPWPSTCFGTTTLITANRSPPAMPSFFSRTLLPLDVPGGTEKVTRPPSSVGASTFAPSTASDSHTGTSTSSSLSSRRK